VDEDTPRLGKILDSAPEPEGAPEGSAQRIDRRDMVKKVAIGASAVWVAPKIEGLSMRPGFAGRLSHCSGSFRFDEPLSGSVNDSRTDASSPVGLFEREVLQACGPFAVRIRQDYQPATGPNAFSTMAVNVGWTSDTCTVDSLSVDGKHHAINAPVQTGPLGKATYILFSNTSTDSTDSGLDARPSGGGTLHLGVTCT
jgi:hypothetical protein